ncbi:YTH domain-containing protein 1 [Drosophila persimilis]|uniref:YTH domain-containing protein 1 n=1 Tax=Drosophila persimilis TaxID=7234 RepID=UPI000F07CDB7|nr:YTH domain-containing protein 1 [Drosophila persimilis]
MPRAASKQTLPMRDMADLDAVNLGLDENEADIAEELQDFEFNTRSEASESNGGESSDDSEPSISSVSTATSSLVGSGKRKTKTKVKEAAPPLADKKERPQQQPTSKKTKREATPEDLNGSKKKKHTGSESKKPSLSQSSSEQPADKSKAKSPPTEEREAQTKKSSRSKKTPNPNDSGNKSEASDAEDEKPAVPALESDSESSDSDSGTQHKRNGGGGARGKTNTTASSSKSSTPEKDGGSSQTQKGYDYMTKLNYLFRDTRFFLIKSNNIDNVQLSKGKSVWATLPQNDANLNQAFKEARNVLLIFSVNESGKFAGFARMAAPSRRDIPQVAWVLPPSISPKALGGVIELDWICRKELSFNATLHLHNTWNEGKPVKIGRDGQEIEPKIGGELCRLFPEDEQIELTPILKKSKETARVMREKGMHVIYKPPRSLSSRGHGHGNGGGGGGGRGGSGHNHLGPMRHKRSYHGQQHQHRPYHRHPHHGMGGMPQGGGGGFKRGGSPYRQMGGAGGGGAPGGPPEMSMPSWERYMSSAAAAEAYVADYMRNMHGQLPPLPFVPPFAQMPLPGTAGAAGAMPPGATAAMYEQLPPPVRYYDGPGAPPLPDYPPPQRPPPPGFDKAPSYEEFAAWKNAGLATVPPPGFPVYGGSAANGGSNGVAGGPPAPGMGGAGVGGAAGGVGGGPGYRNRDNNGAAGGGRRREYGNRSGSSRDSRSFRGDRGGGGGGGGQRSYRDNRR